MVAMAWPLLSRFSNSEPEPIAFTPIALIDLPPQPAEPGTASEPEAGLTSIAPFPQQPSSSPPALPTAPLPRPFVNPVPSDSSGGDTLADSSPPLQPTPPSLQSETIGTSTTEATIPDGERLESALESQATATTPEPAAASPLPSIASDAPEFATIPIEIPTPDVSETLPISPSPSPSPLAQVDVSREITPVNLTVRLDFERMAAEKAGDNPDRLAAPEGGVESREISTVDESACAGALKPEVMQSLGVKIALQVSTDVRGQVTQTAAQSVSQNPAYNELARCLVQHWGFVPAEDEGEPVPSSALLVWVTIDQP